ncbi:hypothetical protein ACOMHN_010799 [Nucella lapillus]
MLAGANRKLDDDGIMVGIYEDMQEELRDRSQTLVEKQQQIEGLEREVMDLQSEFELERRDYLDTIRRQERHLQLLDAIITRVQPCLRRDCNYYNLDKIRAECRWDEDEGRWVLPKLVLSRTALPGTVQGRWVLPKLVLSRTALPGTGGARSWRPVSGEGSGADSPEEDASDDRLRECWSVISVETAVMESQTCFSIAALFLYNHPM